MGILSKKKTEEEVGKDKDEILKEIVSSLKKMNERIDNVEGTKAPVAKLPEQEVVATTKPVAKKGDVESVFTVQDMTTQSEKVIVDMGDPNNPKVYDTSTALAELLNKLTRIEKNIG